MNVPTAPVLGSIVAFDLVCSRTICTYIIICSDITADRCSFKALKFWLFLTRTISEKQKEMQKVLQPTPLSP